MIVRGWIGACLLLLAGTAWAQEGSRPNILLIFADNLGYGDLGCYGNREIRTPHLDRLAQQGVRCTNFYVASPTCTVSRASLLTGRYPQRHGLLIQLPGLEGNYGVGLRHSEVLLPQLLAESGYRTACFGKWNIGFAPGSRPTERGFDQFLGHASGNIHYYLHTYHQRLDLHRGTEPARIEGYSTDLFADAACEFIRRRDDRPFFIYLPFNAVHFLGPHNMPAGEPPVWQVPDRYLREYGWPADESDPRRLYQAVVTAMDDAIGRVLAELDAAGQAENTLVVFLSDNGAFMIPDKGLEVASNGPLRDGGVTLWEGGIRVPAIARWPGAIASGTTCEELLFSCDVLPLCVAAAGAKLPGDRSIDGRNPVGALAGQSQSPHEALYFQFRNYSAVRRGRWKLLRDKPDAMWMLFDLDDDVGETRDLAAEQPQRVAAMAAGFQQWLSDVQQP